MARVSDHKGVTDHGPEQPGKKVLATIFAVWPRVAPAAEGAVHRDLARSGIERLDELPGEHRDVDGHVKQDGQEMK